MENIYFNCATKNKNLSVFVLGSAEFLLTGVMTMSHDFK